MSNNEKQIMHVVSATHWDREWIIPFEGYLANFIDYTDKLITIMESDPEFKHYQMDGQSICMEDYLLVRPEQTESVNKLVKDGRLLLGPWYTLPDMNLNCGEAIVRNLQVGIQVSNELGGSMMEGYTACSNGQIAQLPQIYAGFGINNAIIYKGVRQDSLPREFLWRSPDGTEAFTLHLSARYGRGAFFTLLFHEVISNVIHDDPANDTWEYMPEKGEIPFRVDGQQFHHPSLYNCLRKEESFYPEHLKPYLTKLRKLESYQSLSSQLITFHGMDHTPPFVSTPKLIAAANDCFDDLEVIDSSLPVAMAALEADVDKTKLVVHEGEFRETRIGGQDRNTNIATLSARMDVKIVNRQTEHALIDQAEPLCTWSWLNGAKYNDTLLKRAWKHLLANHGHDSIDGCSMDKVNRDVLGRYGDCQTICESLTQKTLGGLLENQIPGALGKAFVTLFNPGLKAQSGLCEMIIDLPDDKNTEDVVLIDENERRIVPQIKSKEAYNAMIYGIMQHPMACSRYRVLFEAKDVPAMGCQNFRLERGDVEKESVKLSPSENTLQNDYLRVSIQDDGRLDILCKETGIEQKGLHYFKDCEDMGNPWNFTPTDAAPITNVGSKAEIELIENGHLRATYRIKTIMNIPRELIIISEISLTRSGKYLDVKTTIENSSRNHKLVACFPSGMNCEKTYAGGQYEVMERPVALPDMSGWGEPVTGYPNYGFAGLSDGKNALSLLNIGMPEYFVEDNNVMTLTLLRAVQLKHGWPEGHDSVKEGHCLGTLTCHYAIYPHAGNWQDAGLWDTYQDFAVPLICTQYLGQPSPGNGNSMISLDSDSLQVSCVKKAEDDDSLVIRFWNPLAEEQGGSINTAFPINEVSYVDFNENPLNNQAIDLKADKDTVKFRVGRNKIITLKISL